MRLRFDQDKTRKRDNTKKTRSPPGLPPSWIIERWERERRYREPLHEQPRIQPEDAPRRTVIIPMIPDTPGTVVIPGDNGQEEKKRGVVIIQIE